MNIAVLHFHRLGGSGIIAYEIGLAMAQLGHNVHFIGLEFPFRNNINLIQKNHIGNIFFHKIQFQEYPVFDYQPYGLATASQVAEWIEQYNINVIHSHYAIPHAICALLARQILNRPHLKCILTLHGTDITIVGSQPSMRSITCYAIRQSDQVIAVSNYLKAKTQEIFDPQKKIDIKVLYNFVNPSYVQNSLKSKQINNEKIILHSSNLREVKSPLDVIHIFHHIQMSIPNSKLWIVGDGPLRTAMESLINEYNITDKVIFKGIVKDVFNIKKSADLMLMPSKDESFGLSALESMSLGIPVIARAVGGLKEIITHNENGFLFNDNDLSIAIETGIKILKDKILYERISNNAIKTTQLKEFSMTKIVQEYEKIYLGSNE